MRDLKGIESWFRQTVGNHFEESTEAGSIRLAEHEVYELLDQVGVARARSNWLAKNHRSGEFSAWVKSVLDLARIPESGQRVVLKVAGRNLLHKTELEGVRVLDFREVEEPGGELARTLDQMSASVEAAGALGDLEGWLATEFVPHQANRPGQEILLSLRQDAAFGPCVVLGIGGTLTEWFGDATGGNSTLIFPVSGLDLQAVGTALAEHPTLRILSHRSRLYPEAPVSLSVLTEAVGKLARLGEKFGPGSAGTFTLEELEINPAVASGGKLLALDGVGLVSVRKWASHRRSTERITNLLKPRSAVVLGASAKGMNPGRIILENLKISEGVDSGRLFAVHQREKEISGVPCYGSVADLPEKCDLAVVSIPAEGALDSIRDLVDNNRAESIILIPGGFAETGQTGLAEAIENVLQAGHARPGGGPVMVGGNCLGIVSRSQYNTFFLPVYKLPFNPGRGRNLAMISQSGAYLVTFASNYDGLIQPAASISFGNQMDLTVSDFLDHFCDDPEVDVVACYVEGFRTGDGVRFLEAARRARRAGKKVLAFKAGKTALGAEAAASHTASLAGNYAVARSCLESAGVILAETLDEFEDLIKIFTLLSGKPAQGSRTGIISNAGFECSTVMDQLAELELAEFPPETMAVLDRELPSFAHRTNPIDCTPMTGTAAFAASCRAILECPTVDVAILSSVPVTPALDNLPADPAGKHRENLDGTESQPSVMVDIIATSAKPAVVVVDSGRIYDPMCGVLEKAGIPVFRKIDRAARALSAFCRS